MEDRRLVMWKTGVKDQLMMNTMGDRLGRHHKLIIIAVVAIGSQRSRRRASIDESKVEGTWLTPRLPIINNMVGKRVCQYFDSHQNRSNKSQKRAGEQGLKKLL